MPDQGLTGVLRNLDPNLVAVGLTALSVVIAVLMTYIFARRSFVATESSKAALAAAEIRGHADLIKATHTRVMEMSDEVRLLQRRLDETNTAASRDPATQHVGLAAGLLRRSMEASEDKRAIGRYVRRFVPPSARIAVDCGTVAAWTYYEIFHEGPVLKAVFTNNILVSAMTDHRFVDRDADAMRHSMLTDERPSACYLIGGWYYPGYGATLNRSQDDRAQLPADLQASPLDLVVIGTTSLQIRSGPRGRSEENRSFKRLLIEEGCRYDQTILVIAMEAYKIGLALGDPCDQELWKTSLMRKNTWIVVGGVPAPPTGEIAARLTEEALVMKEGQRDLGWRAQLLVLNNDGSISSRFSIYDK